jgi:hypothetical protein
MPNWWALKFEQPMATFFAQNSVLRDAEKWNVVILSVPFLDRNTEIVGGVVNINANSKMFSFAIAPQKAAPGPVPWGYSIAISTNCVIVCGK